MVAVFLAVAAINELDRTDAYRAAISRPTDLAGYLGTIENGRTFGPLAGDQGVGTFGGSEDHTAILCCRPATLSQYRFAPVEFERDVPMPAGHVFAVAFSGVLAEKTGAALATYNRASHAAARVLEIWREASGLPVPTLEAAVSGRDGAADAIREAIADAGDTEFGTACCGSVSISSCWRAGPSCRARATHCAPATSPGSGRWSTDRSRPSRTWLGNQMPETVSPRPRGPPAWSGGRLGVRRGVRRQRLGTRRGGRLRGVPPRVARGVRSRSPGGRGPRGVLRNQPGAGGVQAGLDHE